MLKENKASINTLKKDNKQKEQIITTYKYILDEYKKGNLENTKNQVFECRVCEDKRFVSKDSLSKHYLRRHPKSQFCDEIEFPENNLFNNKNSNNYNNNQNNQYISKEQFNNTSKDNQKINDIEKNIEEMKHHFEGFLKSNVNETYMKLYETQKNLENNVTELKGDKGKLTEIENAISKMSRKISKIKEKNSAQEKEKEIVNTSHPMSEVK